MPEIIIPYAPRREMKAFHARTARRAVLVAHRRYGKTVGCVNDLIRRGVTFPRNDGRFGYIAPFLSQAKLIAWDYLKRFAGVIPGVRFNESELKCTLPNGTWIRLFGADNSEALRGTYFDGVVLDEPADMDEDFYRSVISPTLIDRQGWVVWIGTPKGRNEFFRIYDRERLDPEAFTLFLPASSTGIISERALREERAKIGDQVFMREYECDFSAAIEGAIYGVQVNAARGANRIRNFPADPRASTYTFWDIGCSDFTSVWLVQMVGRDICLLDYYCRNSAGVSHYAQRCVDWERDYGLRIRSHFMPHDANKRDLGSGKTYADVAKEAGLEHIQIVPRTPDIWMGINALRELFPRIYIHADNCGKAWSLGERSYPSGIDCLEYYHTKEVSESGIISDKPVHDFHSHGADSLRTFAEAYDRGMIDGTTYNSNAGDTRQAITVVKGLGHMAQNNRACRTSGVRVLR